MHESGPRRKRITTQYPCPRAPRQPPGTTWLRDQLLAAGRRDDFLQGRDMAGEGAPARGGRGHRGLRLLADKGLLHRDITGLRQRLDMSAEIAVGGAGQLLQPGKFQSDGGWDRVERRHDAQAERLMDDIVEFGHRASSAAST